MLRVISGKNKGRKIIFSPRDYIRPTSNMVKEALFNIIQHKIKDMQFLDLFYGSGQIGIEALSRGAAHVTFIDNDLYCKKCLIQNLHNMHIFDNFNIVNIDVFFYLKNCKDIFDIIFLDPPYNLDMVPKVVTLLVDNISLDGIIIAETENDAMLKQKYGTLQMCSSYIYGKKKLTIYKNGNKS